MTPTQHERLERIRAQASPGLRAEIDLLVDSLVHGREGQSVNEEGILSGSQLAEIEMRNRLNHVDDAISPEIAALCKTARALRKENQRLDAIVSAYENQDEEALAEAEGL